MARFSNGWFKVYRPLVDGDIGSNCFTLGIFIKLLSWANLEPTTIRFNGTPRTLERGQLVTGIRELADALNISKSTVLRHLEYLQRRDTLKREVGTLGSLITINNFNSYQENEKTRDTQRDTDGFSEGQQRTLNEEYKNKELKNTYAHFVQLAYESYPRKEGKSRGFKTLLKSITSETLGTQLVLAVKNYADSKRGTEKQYLKLFSSFANEWTDWISPDTAIVPKTSRVDFG